ncbi:MAG: hypothetical protein K0V04_01445 [Deltaproteobacteria bacterium]|nr:hypothetical protein [Deltaproteobacteria bacterium]
MANGNVSELRLAADLGEVRQALVDALPKTVIVRDEDDGVGSFAGERAVMMVGHGGTRLMLFNGSWRSIKSRLDDPHVDVELETVAQGVVAKITAEPTKPRGISSHIGDFVSQVITIAALVVAYHYLRSIPVDYAFVAMLAVGGGAVWSVIGRFMPTKEIPGLDDVVLGALQPLAAEDAEEAAAADAPSA